MVTSASNGTSKFFWWGFDAQPYFFFEKFLDTQRGLEKLRRSPLSVALLFVSLVSEGFGFFWKIYFWINFILEMCSTHFHMCNHIYDMCNFLSSCSGTAAKIRHGQSDQGDVLVSSTVADFPRSAPGSRKKIAHGENKNENLNFWI